MTSPPPRCRRALALLLPCLVGLAGGSDPKPLPTDEHGDYNGADLVEWIRSHPEGRVHPSLRIGRETPGDPTSLLGLFASSDPNAEPIEEGDVLARIPWERMIHPGMRYSAVVLGGCATVRRLAKELELGEESEYAPYVRYLLSQPRGTLPGEWTPAGQDFLSEMLDGDELPPYDEMWKHSFRIEWLEYCAGSEDDDYETRAFWLAKARDEDTLMVPVYDMANHSNDPVKLNTLSEKPAGPGDSFLFAASRAIKPGEQIYNSYNRCNPCHELGPDERCETVSFHRTPELFAWYGFAEGYPQSWRLDPGEHSEDPEDQWEGTYFDFCLEEDPEREGELVSSWEEGEVVNEHDVRWLRMHRARLTELLTRKDALEEELVEEEEEEGEGDGTKKMRRREWEAAWRYHEALVRAVDAEVDAAEAANEEDSEDDVEYVVVDDEDSSDDHDEL
ncbi:hypothetical protein ACHAWF_006329 [Thalassiosira exigua]